MQIRRRIVPTPEPPLQHYPVAGIGHMACILAKEESNGDPPPRESERGFARLITFGEGV
jgi:hypothetical protein